MTARGSGDSATGNGVALDWLNFFLADITGGLGPFLAIYLMYSRNWNAGQIGIVLSIGGIATVAALGPAGAVVDTVSWKRTLIAVSAGIVAAASVAIALDARFWTVSLSIGASGVADAVFPIAVTAMSLGIVGRQAFTGRNGRNQAWNHGGNVITAIAVGVAGYIIAPEAILWMVAALAVANAVAVYCIDGRAIDNEAARGASENDGETQEGLRYVAGNRPLLWFTAAITLFHFANAAMLPLAGEKLSQTDPRASTLFMASCIIVAQAVMVPMAILVGRKADSWGRKPIFLAGFASLLLRGFLFSISDNPYSTVAIQVLDGVGGGVFRCTLCYYSGRFHLWLKAL